MKISVIHKTSDYRGDHDADVSLAYEVNENETVDSLCNRILFDGTRPLLQDHIELRLIKEQP